MDQQNMWFLIWACECTLFIFDSGGKGVYPFLSSSQTQLKPCPPQPLAMLHDQKNDKQQ